MKFTDRMKQILMARIQWNHDHTQLCGCFTFAEIIYLNDILGVTNRYQGNLDKVKYARINMEKGENGRSWFYFEPRQDLNPKDKTHDIRGSR